MLITIGKFILFGKMRNIRQLLTFIAFGGFLILISKKVNECNLSLLNRYREDIQCRIAKGQLSDADLFIANAKVHTLNIQIKSCEDIAGKSGFAIIGFAIMVLGVLDYFAVWL